MGSPVFPGFYGDSIMTSFWFKITSTFTGFFQANKLWIHTHHRKTPICRKTAFESLCNFYVSLKIQNDKINLILTKKNTLPFWFAEKHFDTVWLCLNYFLFVYHGEGTKSAWQLVKYFSRTKFEWLKIKKGISVFCFFYERKRDDISAANHYYCIQMINYKQDDRV